MIRDPLEIAAFPLLLAHRLGLLSTGTWNAVARKVYMALPEIDEDVDADNVVASYVKV
jgi:hypothetical protein